MALATTASLDTEFAGFQILLKVFKARCHSSSSIAAPQTQAGQNPIPPPHTPTPSLPWSTSCMECISPTEETLHSLKHSKSAAQVLLFASHMFHWRRPKGCLDEACASLTVSFTVLSFLSGQTTAGASVGEYLINEALPLAIAMVRDDGGHSPLEAAEVLVSCICCFLSPQHLQLSSCFPCELVVTNPVQQPPPPPPPLPSPRSIICSIPVKTQTSCGQQTL